MISDQTEAIASDEELDTDAQFPEEFRRQQRKQQVQQQHHEEEEDPRVFHYKGTPERERKVPSRRGGRRSRTAEQVMLIYIMIW